MPSRREHWRAVPGFVDYEASNWGRVRSWAKASPAGRAQRAEPLILKGSVQSPSGLRRYCLEGRWLYGSRIVALSWGRLDSFDDERLVGHRDGDRSNDQLGNLVVYADGERRIHCAESYLRANATRKRRRELGLIEPGVGGNPQPCLVIVPGESSRRFDSIADAATWLGLKARTLRAYVSGAKPWPKTGKAVGVTVKRLERQDR